MAWIQLTSHEQLRDAIDISEKKPQVFFKHSTRCIISKMALQEFERTGVINSSNTDFYLLDLLNFRSISNEISVKLNVLHQSPQAIMLYKNEIVYSQTHERIDGNEVKSLIDSLQ
jgi:bacillithiol system protein YtxJ